MPDQQNTYRVFISSTFNDFKSERDALQQRVWPALTKYCKDRGFNFQAIDLRWGISEAAAHASRLMEICLGEIDRCQRLSPRPNFIIFVGNRYGYRPLPEEIPDIEFKNILSQLSAEERVLLVGNSTPESGWYRLDENSLYEYKEQILAGIWRLRYWSEMLSSYQQWVSTERRIRGIFRKALSSLNLSFKQRTKYELSATQQEFEHGAVRHLDGKEHIFAFVRDIEGIPESECDYADYTDWEGGRVRDEEASRLLSAFRERIEEGRGVWLKGIFHYHLTWENRHSRLHLDRFCRHVQASLLLIINKEIAKRQVLPPEKREGRAQEDFLHEKLEVFIGRHSELHSVADYLSRGGPKPLVMVGEGGVGKSALVARSVQEARECHPDAVIIYKFCGITAASSKEGELLKQILYDLNTEYARPADPALDGRDISHEVAHAITLAGGASKPLFIFLDGVDQLETSGLRPTLSWIPSDLPPNVRIVLSCLPELLPDSLRNFETLKISPPRREEARMQFEGWLAHRRRRLHGSQKDKVFAQIDKCSLPLYVKLLVEQATWWRSYNPVPDIPATLPELIYQTLGNFSTPERHGPVLFGAFMSYLAASRSGLSEDELLDLLSADDEVWENFVKEAKHAPPARRLPMAPWSRLRLDLAPYLREFSSQGAHLIGFYHRMFGELIEAKYLPDAETRAKIHARLADYFLACEPSDSPRRLSELPWHLARTGDWQRLFDLLSDIYFAMALWRQNQQEVVEYWRQIEMHSALRLVDAYSSILNSVIPGDDRAVFVTKLLHRVGHNEEAATLLDTMIRMSRELDNISDRLHYLSTKASLLREQGEYDAALALLKEEEEIVRKYYNRNGLRRRWEEKGRDTEELAGLLNEFDESSDFSVAPSLGNQAMIFEAKGDLETALELHHQVEEIYQRHEYTEGEAHAIACQAHIYQRLFDFDRAERLYEKAASLFRRAGDPNKLARVLNLHAEVLYEQGREGEVIPLLEEALSLLQRSGDMEVLTLTLGRLTESLASTGQLSLALSRAEKVRELCQERGDEKGLLLCDLLVERLTPPKEEEEDMDDLTRAIQLFGRASDYMQEQRWDEAIPLLQESERLFTSTGLTDYATEAAKQLRIAIIGKG